MSATVPQGGTPVTRLLVLGPSRFLAEAVAATIAAADIEAAGTTYEDLRRSPARPGVDVVLVLDPAADLADEIGARLHEVTPHASVVLLARHLDDDAHRVAARLGASGILSRETRLDALEELVRAGGVVAAPDGAGGPARSVASSLLGELTEREQEILTELLSGDTGADIAGRLGISEHTVRTHVQNILSKLGVTSRFEAAAVALRAGFRPPTGAGRGR